MKKRKIKPRASAAQTVRRDPVSVLTGLLLSAVIAAAAGILLLLLLCPVLLFTDDPWTYAAPAAALLPLPAAILCGVLSARSTARGGLVSGLLGGLLFCVLLFALGAVLPGVQDTGNTVLLSPLLRAGLCTVCSALGGYSVTHRKPRTPHRRHP